MNSIAGRDCGGQRALAVGLRAELSGELGYRDTREWSILVQCATPHSTSS